MGLDQGLYIKRKKQKKLDWLCTWRKNNAIHRYICTSVAGKEDINCEEILISKEQLEDLYNRTLNVLECRNEKVSSYLLPTMDGFFFGNTEYNEFYYNEIQEASEDLRGILKDLETHDYDVYYHSWY